MNLNDDFASNMFEYDEYLKRWLAGIKSEAVFWDNLFKSRGCIGWDSKVFDYRMNPTCPFQLIDDLEDTNSRILDVGSGPYSRLGFCFNDRKLDITLVDPLAYIYKCISKKYKLELPLELKTGLVEYINLLFNENSFDFVHMSNSLDHCFNPIEGILQLLYVTKVGGKIVLRHSDDEAERERYNGFHQWNLKILEGEFVIWRNDISPINVSDYIADFAEIESATNAEEKLFDDTWKFNKVVIRKKKSFYLNSKYVTNILIALLNEIEKIIMESV